MRVVADTSAPALVLRYLLPDERQVITVRFHPARFIPPLVTVLGALSLAIALTPVLQGTELVAAWLITLVLIGNLLYTAVDWLSSYLVITSHRIFLVDGSGTTLEWEMSDVKDVRLVRPLGGRFLGYGTLIFGSERMAIECLPYPEQLYLEILGLLYKEPDADQEAK